MKRMVNNSTDTAGYTYKLLTQDEANGFIAEIKQVGVLSFGQHLPVLSPENAAGLIERLNQDSTWINLLATSKCFVCMKGNELIGMAHFVPGGNPWDIFKAEWAYLRMVGVNPQYQGQGIARKLTQMCIDYAQQTNEKTIALHTSEFMDAARHIYESLGFTILEEIPLRMGKRYWLYTLELD
jgi:ribosomal protein S18 acetylase RimI-like enzyme